MNDKGNDVLMRLMLTSGTPLYAECQTEVDTDLDDFVSDYYNGEFFEVTEFSFGMNLDDKDPASEAVNTAASVTAPAHLAPVPVGAGGAVKAASRMSFAEEIAMKAAARAANSSGPPTSKFARWKSATPDEIASMPPYRLQMDEFSITRLYDKASPVLFEKCCNSDSIVSASLVKRKLIGADMLRGFLRIDFDDLLLTHIEWENGDVVKETFKFVFRKITVTYRTVSYAKGSNLPQLKTMPTVSWNYDMELKKKPS
jgi:type VI protein secretion system component Hcp